MYYVNPSTYWIGGMLAATLNGAQVRCAPEETALFDVPPGQTCQQYAGAFAETAGGYLLNPDATSACQYCPFSSGNQYLETLNISADQKWRSMLFLVGFDGEYLLTMGTDFGIFLAFCISNWALVYFFIYTVRVRLWTFGFGKVFGGLGKLVDMAQKPFQRKAESKE